MSESAEGERIPLSEKYEKSKRDYRKKLKLY